MEIFILLFLRDKEGPFPTPKFRDSPLNSALNFGENGEIHNCPWFYNTVTSVTPFFFYSRGNNLYFIRKFLGMSYTPANQYNMNLGLGFQGNFIAGKLLPFWFTCRIGIL